MLEIVYVCLFLAFGFVAINDVGRIYRGEGKNEEDDEVNNVNILPVALSMFFSLYIFLTAFSIETWNSFVLTCHSMEICV